MKSFFKSKINWSAFCIAMLAVLPAIQDLLDGLDMSTMNFVQWATFIIAVLIIIFRTFGNSVVIKTKKAIRAKRRKAVL